MARTTTPKPPRPSSRSTRYFSPIIAPGFTFGGGRIRTSFGSRGCTSSGGIDADGGETDGGGREPCTSRPPPSTRAPERGGGIDAGGRERAGGGCESGGAGRDQSVSGMSRAGYEDGCGGAPGLRGVIWRPTVGASARRGVLRPIVGGSSRDIGPRVSASLGGGIDGRRGDSGPGKLGCRNGGADGGPGWRGVGGRTGDSTLVASVGSVAGRSRIRFVLSGPFIAGRWRWYHRSRTNGVPMGSFRKRKRRRNLFAPEPLDEVLERAGDHRFAKKQLPIPLAQWRHAVGPRIADRARPLELARGVLLVKVATSVWANELSMLAPQIIAKLCPPYDVKSLRFRVGPLDVIEGITTVREYRRIPPPAPLGPDLTVSLGRIEDLDLRAIIEKAARQNLAWQAMPPAPGAPGAEFSAKLPAAPDLPDAERGTARPGYNGAGSGGASPRMRGDDSGRRR